MPFPSGCSDHDFTYLMRLFRQQKPPAPLREDELRLMRAGWLYRADDGSLSVTNEVAAHFRETWRPIVVEPRSRWSK